MEWSGRTRSPPQCLTSYDEGNVSSERHNSASDGKSFAFEVDAFKKHCLMNGLDDIGLTLEKAASIDSYEARVATQRPWA